MQGNNLKMKKTNKQTKTNKIVIMMIMYSL